MGPPDNYLYYRMVLVLMDSRSEVDLSTADIIGNDWMKSDASVSRGFFMPH
uniref:Uncharacterized protein n=1 Tax=Salmonella sp. TaxID=599 RepID=A0A482ETR3_SALSP|nr:hypothetical protein NNIBIDOC_00204 [Salmonella sp.]